jgi:hypothetical protein
MAREGDPAVGVPGLDVAVAVVVVPEAAAAAVAGDVGEVGAVLACRTCGAGPAKTGYWPRGSVWTWSPISSVVTGAATASAAAWRNRRRLSISRSL